MKHRTKTLLLALGLLWPGAPLVADDEVDGTRAALEQWVETRRLISQEKRDWALGRELLGDRISIVQSEIESLRTAIGEAQESIAAADKTRAELEAENERLKSGSAGLEETVATLEGGVRALLPRLPEPALERVRPLAQSLPEDGAETELSLGRRFQNVVGILDQIDKLEREVTPANEVRELGGGTSAEVAVIYVGVGHAWYASADKRFAGVGTAGPDGWTWTPANDAAQAIALAIAIQRVDEPAAFVQVPIAIDGAEVSR